MAGNKNQDETQFKSPDEKITLTPEEIEKIKQDAIKEYTAKKAEEEEAKKKNAKIKCKALVTLHTKDGIKLPGDIIEYEEGEVPSETLVEVIDD